MNWRNWFKSTYTLSLETEVERLRSENRSLLEAMLKANGLPSIAKPEPKELPPTKARLTPSQWRRQIEARHPEQEKKPA